MTKRMLIDSTNAEETRVVVLDGNRLEDFDVETSTKRQLKGNIYLAKIVRVEPSLQAAFVEFGGGRHGFLAFGEIHPDYYQIPVADRKRLIELQEAEAREDEEEEDRAAAREEAGEPPEPEPAPLDVPEEPDPAPAAADDATEAAYAVQADPEAAATPDEPTPLPDPEQVSQPAAIAQDIVVAPEEARALFADPAQEGVDASPPGTGPDLAPEAAEPGPDMFGDESAAEAGEIHDMPFDAPAETAEPAAAPDSVGGETETDEVERPERRSTPRFMRNYKIQEVIRRRQILLVQVVKEERGTKGAALTTYISLAGRFSVLMPNSPRGGGISRKITSASDRRRLKEVTAELDLPRGMGLIVRTAGANRPKAEILRDGEYLLGQWDEIRELTMQSVAPALIYEEASLIKRAIRDVYSRDVDEITVDGEQGWRAARDFMRMLMPSHAKKVQLWRDPQPLFAKAQVEAQLDGMLQPNVQLRSGGYLVINQTEALVAIDVNSGRSTRERGIEETALRTNLEAADEAARQLRLRDLAGLIVIDFIDMESRRNNAAVERRLKDALRHDRARIQVGSISHFGLLEMSRQRLRPSLTETAFVTCPHCGGSGHVRNTESAALAVLRGIEEEGGRRRSAEIVVHAAGSTALYILNNKRQRLAEIEARCSMNVTFAADEGLRAPEMRIERVRAMAPSDLPPPVSQLAPPEPIADAEDEDETDAEPVGVEADASADNEEEGLRRRRRRRRRGGRPEDGAPEQAGEQQGVEKADTEEAEPSAAAAELPAPETEAERPSDAEGERKRRGRRGGRRRRRTEAPVDGAAQDVRPEPADAPEPAAEPAYAPAYVGPTPANPFGGANVFDFFDDVEEQDEPASAPPVRELDGAKLTVAAVPAEPTRDFDPTIAGPDLASPAPAVAHNFDPSIAGPDLASPAPADAHSYDPSIAGPDLPAPAATPAAPELDGAEVAAPEMVAAPVVAPAIQPVLIGADDSAPVEKKRGWWRR